MDRQPVESTNIISAGYDAESQIMEIEFKNGGLYQYFDIPQHLFDEFLAAGSKGAFLSQTIKGNYRYVRV